MSADEQSHLEVILEDMNGKFDLILEGHVTLEHMIHEHRVETRQDKRELQALIKTSHDSLDAKVNKVSNELKETRAELSAKINKVSNELKETRNELKETKVELSAKVEAVGDKVNDIDARDNALGHKVESHEDRIRFLERKAA